jgi:hypothetical protein
MARTLSSCDAMRFDLPRSRCFDSFFLLCGRVLGFIVDMIFILSRKIEGT